MNTKPLDEKKVEAFADRMVDALNNSAVVLMSSIGHQTGLFDTMSELPPSKSQQIAEKAGLNERYVREWLGTMVTGCIVEYNPADKTYFLPPEHAASLCRASGADNLTVFAQYIPVLGDVEQQIIHCFKNGGGVPYSEYPRFHAVMAEDSGLSVLTSLTDVILPLVPGLIDKLNSGIEVLDVGCGSGRAINKMAESFPNSTFYGYDFSEEAIGNANNESQKKGLTNTKFEIKDVSKVDGEARFDLITAFDAIHDQAEPAVVLKAIYNTLKSDGTFFMQDIAGSSHVENNMDHPIGPLLYTISCMHCMTVSLAQGGKGLGAMWGKELALQMLNEAGFTNVDVHRLDHDVQNDYYVATK